jgi:CheY-like chemotaxis protein
MYRIPAFATGDKGDTGVLRSAGGGEMQPMAGSGRVLAVVGDPFFKSKIQETAKQTGVPMCFVTTEASLQEALSGGGVGLVVVDLGITSFDPISAIMVARSAGGVRTIAYVSHVDEDGQRAAVEAGCDAVLPKSVFTRDLPLILLQGAKP